MAVSINLCRNAVPELQDPWEQRSGKGGQLTEKGFHYCLPRDWCGNTTSPSGIQGATNIAGGMEERGAEELERSGCFPGSRSVGWNPLRQQPFPAPAASSSWLVQPGFPCALSLFQLLPFTSPGLHTRRCSQAARWALSGGCWQRGTRDRDTGQDRDNPRAGCWGHRGCASAGHGVYLSSPGLMSQPS